MKRAALVEARTWGEEQFRQQLLGSCALSICKTNAQAAHDLRLALTSLL